MDPDAMTMLLGDAICNIEEKEYWEACQHALKSPYEGKISAEDEEGGEAFSDDDEGSIARVIVVVTVVVVTTEMVKMIVAVIMVVKIPIWILRSYDFTISPTQNDLNLSRIFAVVQDR